MLLSSLLLASAAALAVGGVITFPAIVGDDNNSSDALLDESIRFLADGAPPAPWENHVGRVITRGTASLGLRLSNALVGNTNLVLSPLSISSALALVLLGAAGRTREELTAVLGLPPALSQDAVHAEFGRLLDHLSPESHAVVANAIFLQMGFPITERFAAVSRDAYRSEVLSLDFVRRGVEAQDAVNRWVENKTMGRLKNFLATPPSPDTRVLIASAIYFNGEWETPFSVDATASRQFHVSKSEVLMVPTMVNALEIPYAANPSLGCRVVGLPYKGRETTLYVLLPDATGLDALHALERRLTAETLEQLLKSTEKRSVILSLPRMRLERTTHLQDSLQKLGVRALFDAHAADLSGLSPGTAKDENFNQHGDYLSFSARLGAANPGLYASDVVHKVEVEVTETGTVASAVTMVSVTRDGSHKVVRVDHPFIFVIRHEPTGLLLFWGSVVRPTSS